MLVLYVTPYALIAIIAVLGVLHPRFDDNLLQRIGLSFICFGATLRVIGSLHHASTDGACLVLAYGLLAYAIGTTLKLRKEGKL